MQRKSRKRTLSCNEALTWIAPSFDWETLRRLLLPLLSSRDCLEPTWESRLSQLNDVSRMDDNLGSTSSLSCLMELIS